MADKTFQIVFDGRLVEGAAPERVKANLAGLFNTGPDRIEPLFSGRRTVVKKNLDEATARKYLAAFEKAGAVASIVDTSEPRAAEPAAPRPAAAPAGGTPAPATAEPAPPPAASPAADEAPNRLATAEAGRAPPPLVARGTPSAPEDMTMADAGAVLADSSAAADAPDIDTSHLSLSEPGVDLAESRKVAAPEFDLSGLELAPAGTSLGGASSDD